MDIRQECPVCLEVKLVGKLKPCDHAFCPKCIHMILHESASCPLCRCVFMNCVPPLVVFDDTVSTVMMTSNKNKNKYGIGVQQYKNDVIISSIDKWSTIKGIEKKKNHRIVAINNLPCYNKKCLIEILKADGSHYLHLEKFVLR